jgi:four helix bundle protein
VNEIRRKHRDLRVWQEAVALSVLVYRFTERFPRHEQFGLTSQLRRAAVSIAANLAEGAARRSTRELLQFIAIARGSASEVDTLLEICRQVLSDKDIDQIQQSLDRVFLLLLKFESALKKKTQS